MLKMESFFLTQEEKKGSTSMSHILKKKKKVQFCESCSKKEFNSVSDVKKGQ